ncbi:phosphoribosylamine--glycine ligase [Leptolyngbya sp. FACHB-261]|uniref:phosphoribosylamine--glycine ligase n=1 Tax=Leptolyngbya sp. FACHB-261 TaxID=2692806 RepID=UPI001686CC7D|nr:phosphoribosylamine--glycine ligase [Leptolyngbya sp. FACHB-261]MBD2099893.1 phosphoribosylamine--glycine ligase [Leptolyngbya sp. FACHB-261]
MKVLLIGNGGREHALAWKLLQSPQVTQVFCVPGNGGTASSARCQNLSLNLNDFEGMLRIAQVQGVGLTVVGPELPLATGIVDLFQSQGSPIFGPTRAGAQLEASKSWAKALMQEAGVPTARAATFTDAAAAQAYIQEQGSPIVVKADGLASGKGVTVAATIEEAHAAVEAAFAGQFGAAGQTVVIEECLSGEEVSVLALTDGRTVKPLLPAQDYKRLGEQDTGPNTGGMGAYAPAPILTDSLMERVQTTILEPTLAALQKRGIDYRGVLYAGLMITPTGDPYVIEFNCRFGDPETQAILPLLETPLHELLLACVEQRLDQVDLKWHPGAAVCVVLAADGYPDKFERGQLVSGIAKAEEAGAVVFHAGTKLQRGQLLNDGGRVLGVTTTGANLEAAIGQAYAAIEHIQFNGLYYRRDIGARAVKQYGDTPAWR